MIYQILKQYTLKPPTTSSTLEIYIYVQSFCNMHINLFSGFVRSKTWLKKIKELIVICCKRDMLHIAFSKNGHSCRFQSHMLFCSVTCYSPSNMESFSLPLESGLALVTPETYTMIQEGHCLTSKAGLGES